MRILELELLDKKLQNAIHTANDEPIVLTEGGQPVYIVRSLADDDLVDDLLAKSSEFLESIRAARQQKAQGQATTLAEIRSKYDSAPE